MFKRPTLRDVSKAAGGFSTSTVSLALRNAPVISEATRRKIQEAARRLGYRPDPNLAAFNRHRLGRLGVKAEPVIAFQTDFSTRGEVLESYVHREMLEGARSAAEEYRCKIELFPAAGLGKDPKRLGDILKSRGIIGVILAGYRKESRFPLPEIAEFCLVKIEALHLKGSYSTVCSDHREAARLAVRRLRAQGFARLGLLFDDSLPAALAEAYEAGFRYEWSQGEGEDEPAVLKLGTLRLEKAGLSRWARDARLQAILTLDEQQCAEVQRELAGLTCACLGLTLPPGERPGIVHAYSCEGYHAVEQVIGLMQTFQRGPLRAASETLLPPGWNPGELLA